ncbi:MAG: Uma2 family endonuclease [Caldilinea sp. CFX5]|nr:Uma2 family endonuclease [Caldilinea sp. CFX5]
MSAKIVEPPIVLASKPVVTNGAATMTNADSQTNGMHDTLPSLPTFPLESGWRTVRDPVSGASRQVPLTLRDILFPTEDDIGVVYMAQSPMHNLLTGLLYAMLHTYLGVREWLILHDVLVLWGIRGIPPKSPDIVAFPGGRFPAKEKSYRVGRDGPMPAFVIEITSDETRADDLYIKPLHYAALGIQEFLIIDILNKATEPWELIGFRLDNGPYYRRLPADAEGGVTFTTVGLRFVAVNRSRIEVYDSATGQRLFTSEELKAQAEAEAQRAEVEAQRAEVEAQRAEAEAQRAEAEAQRAEAEAQRAEAEAQRAEAEAVRARMEAAARRKAEARNAELERQLRELRSQYNIQSPPEEGQG